jgi:signal peptidase I
MDNPYQPPSAASSAPGAPARDPALAEPTKSEAPRWLAVLLAFFAGYVLLGVGFLILGRTRRAVIWLLVGWAVWLTVVIGVRANVPGLFLAGLPLAVLIWLASLIGTGLTQPAPRRLATGQAVGLAAGVFVLALGVTAVQRRLLIEAFQVPSGNMMPTLLIGDHFFSAKGSRAELGDVIVFRYPPDPSVDYVKRVIARGGDTIEIRDDVVFINGKQLPQTKLADPCPPVSEELGGDQSRCVVLQEQNGSHRYRIQHAAGPTSYGPTTVPAGHLFLMGDSRHNSNDSRVWGTVPVNYVKAKAQFIWWSRLGSEYRWDRIGKIID